MEARYFTKDDALKIVERWNKLKWEATSDFIWDDLFEGSNDVYLTPAKYDAILDFFLSNGELYRRQLIETVIETDSFRNLDLESAVQIRREIQRLLEAEMSDFVEFMLSRIELEDDPAYKTCIQELQKDLLDQSRASLEFSFDRLMKKTELALAITRIGTSKSTTEPLKEHHAKEASIGTQTNLFLAIEASGLSQSYFVEKTGIDKKNFSRYVSGQTMPSDDNKLLIADALAAAMKQEISVGMCQDVQTSSSGFIVSRPSVKPFASI